MTLSEALKGRVCAVVDAHAQELVGVARQIHARPEVGHQEFFAHDLLTDALERAGLAPERKAYDIPTAFAARAGETGPVVAVLCEYDALPEIGHACGHNVIAAAGLGAGIAAAAVAGAADGRLLVLGCPSEEVMPVGKSLLIDAGAFADVDAAMMVHPADADMTEMNTLAVTSFDAHYRGRPAHAAAAPEDGRNALDAAVFGYNAVAALRQHIATAERVHGIFTKLPERANVVPSEVSARWVIRSATLRRLEDLVPRVVACLEAGALAAGCDIELVRMRVAGRDAGPEVRTNPQLVGSYVENMARLGRTVGDPRLGGETIGSTDMGLVSYLVPSIHPLIALAPPGVKIHELEFAEAAGSEAADRAVLDGAKAMAMTVVDYWLDAVLRARTHEAFEAAPA
jgi:amidohydrolase